MSPVGLWQPQILTAVSFLAVLYDSGRAEGPVFEGGEFLLQFGDFFSQVFDYFIYNLLQFYKGLVEGVGLVV